MKLRKNVRQKAQEKPFDKERQSKAGKRKKPLLIYDSECDFCNIWIKYWKLLTRDKVDYASFQDVARHFPQISPKEFQKSVKLVMRSGEVLSGAEAVFKALHVAHQKRWLFWMYGHVPVFAWASEVFYRFVASHRGFGYWSTVFLFGSEVKPPIYRLSSWLFLKILGVIYFVAFASFGVQMMGLIGADGILPIGEFIESIGTRLGSKGFWYAPTLFWLSASDWFLKAIVIAGLVSSLLLIAGLMRKLMLALMFVFYLSLVVAGQVFMAFQWDSLLLEAGFLALFLGRSSTLGVWLFRLLLFKLMFLGGAAKLLSGDAAWRGLTALTFHYETQPLPTIFGWYAHQLPQWFHKFSVLMTFFIELIVPFLIFATRHLRFFAGFALIVLQALIFITGNYTIFNILAIALILFLFDDAFLSRIFPSFLTRRIHKNALPANSSRSQRIAKKENEWGLRRIGVAAVVAFIVLANILLMMNIFASRPSKPIRSLLSIAQPFRIVNSYGLFATMTNPRYEIVIEGSNDGETWLPYEFKYKPGDVTRSPRWVQPHQPRLDWQMWFAALSDYQRNPWFVNLISRLLEGSPHVVALLEKNPFPDKPPQSIRAVFYEYHFTDLKTKKEEGAWWQREYKGLYFPVASLK